MDGLIIDSGRTCFSDDRSRHGFTLIETIVAMFIMLVGIVFVVGAFIPGLLNRTQAKNLIVSQELASMWSDGVRFRIGHGLTINDLKNSNGNFYTGETSLPGAFDRLPTFRRNCYIGHMWKVERVDDYTPQWIDSTTLNPDGTPKPIANRLHNWDAGLKAPITDAPLSPLHEVHLVIWCGGNSFKFTYVFSGVTLKYN